MTGLRSEVARTRCRIGIMMSGVLLREMMGSGNLDSNFRCRSRHAISGTLRSEIGDFIRAASPNFQPYLILLCTNEEMDDMRNV